METVRLTRQWHNGSIDAVRVGSDVFSANFTTRQDIVSKHRDLIIRAINTENLTVTLQPNKMDAEYITVTKDELAPDYAFFKKL